MKAGWEITPLGWLFLALLLAAVLYFVTTRLRRPPQKEK